MSKITEILSGFKNLVWENPKVEKIAMDRALICGECDTNVNNICSSAKGGCGCYIPAKCHSEQSRCPKGKW